MKGEEEEEEAGSVLLGSDLVISLSRQLLLRTEACAYLSYCRLIPFTRTLISNCFFMLMIIFWWV